MKKIKRLDSKQGFSSVVLILAIFLVAAIGVAANRIALGSKWSKTAVTQSGSTQLANSNTVDGATVSPLGYIGCSNSRDAVTGYATVSEKKFFWQPYDTGGKSIEQWADKANSAWQLFDTQLEKYGQPAAVWVQICENEKRAATYEDVNKTLRILAGRVTTKKIYISPLNSYEPSNLCTRLGKDNIQDLVAFSEQAIQDGRALRGPRLGPLTSSLVKTDNCHPKTPEGDNFLGRQLAEFFDTIPPPWQQ